MRVSKVARSLLLLRRPPLRAPQTAALFAASPSLRRTPSHAAAVQVGLQSRHQSTSAAAAPETPAGTAAAAAAGEAEEDEGAQRSTAAAAVHVMERAAEARREIHELWSRTAAAEEALQSAAPSGAAASAEEVSAAEERCVAVAALLEKYGLDPTTPREEDVSRGLGDALDRLLLLCAPLSPTHGTDLLVKLMQVCARQGRQLSMRTIQHLFARTNSYAEALSIFYAMRRSNFAMSMEAYHAMLYSLQRLEEEGWAQRFHDEFAASGGEQISEQALDFVLRGVDNQLLPENKPWLGRVMFAEAKDNAATQRQSRASFDEMGKLWVERYRGGGSGSAAPSQ